jgi:hypothetical protein
MRTDTERRAVKRTIVDAVAGILPSDHATLLPCDVLDLTDRGARLDVGVNAAQLDRPFDFSFDNFRTIRRARRAWHHGSFVGIQFLKS